MKAQKGGKGIHLLLFNLGLGWEEVLNATQATFPWEWPSTHCTGPNLPVPQEITDTWQGHTAHHVPCCSDKESTLHYVKLVQLCTAKTSIFIHQLTKCHNLYKTLLYNYITETLKYSKPMNNHCKLSKCFCDTPYAVCKTHMYTRIYLHVFIVLLRTIK